MPCWLETSVTVNEKLIVRPELIRNAIAQIQSELERIEGYDGYVEIFQKGDELHFRVYATTIVLNLKTGDLSVPDTMRNEANIIKRNYSTQVVRQVAGTGRMRQAFDLKQKSATEFVLQRRARR